MGTLSWTDYKNLILTGYSSALSWTKNPGYTGETKTIEWHIQILNQKLATVFQLKMSDFKQMNAKDVFYEEFDYFIPHFHPSTQQVGHYVTRREDKVSRL